MSTSMVESAVKRLYIDDFGAMYMVRFDGTSKLVGMIVQEADYSVDDTSKLDYIHNRPLDNAVVKNPSIRYDNGAVFVGSTETDEVELSSLQKESIAFNIVDFKEGLFFAAGDIVLFNEALWICTITGVQVKNPSINKNFKLVHKYEFAQKICELEDTRLSVVITAESGTSQTTYRINSIFDLYFHTERIDLPNNGSPEEFKNYASVQDGQVTVGASVKAPSLLLITFSGTKTVSFDIEVLDMIDNISVLTIKVNSEELHHFEKNENGDMTWNGIVMAGNKIIEDIIVNLVENDKLYIDYISSGVDKEALPFIIKNLNISY